MKPGVVPLVVGLVGTSFGLMHAQAPPEQKAPAFEVASIKPNRTADLQPSARVLPGGRVELMNITVLRLIQTAFISDTVQLVEQIVGGPDWVDVDRFDIVAKGAVNLSLDPTLGQRGRVMAMIRTLLEDRFRLRTRTDTRQTDVYALVMASQEHRLGPRLTRSAADCYSSASPPPQDTPPDVGRMCGRSGPNGNVTYVGVNMRELAATLAWNPSVSRPVIDKTGLEGRFDLHLEFASPAMRPGDQLPNPVEDSGLFTALAEQAGLKLQRQKSTVEVLVIEHVERPTPD